VLVPEPPQWTVGDTVIAVPEASVKLFAEALAIAPDAHRLFGLSGRRLAATTDGGDGGERNAATLLLLGVGAKRFV
jgi:hypothetical protein